jgi:HAD superfamily hydrolase (TIGR01509 family)
MKISAAIFDLDGTILDNEDEYGKAFKKVLGKLGVEVTSNYPHTSGIGVEENWPKLIEKYKIKVDKSIKELTLETQKEYFRFLDKVRLKKGFKKFIEDLKKSGIQIALATSNTWFVVEKIFDTLPIEKYFDSVTTGEEVDNKKPSPDIFLKAADKLNVDPGKCLVFEDSPAGIEAAHTAGMKVVGIARDNKHAKEIKKADLVINDYLQFTPQLALSI